MVKKISKKNCTFIINNLKEIDPSALLSSGDLTQLGVVSTKLDEITEKFPDDSSARMLFQSLSELCGLMILGEEPDTNKSHRILSKSIEIIRATNLENKEQLEKVSTKLLEEYNDIFKDEEKKHKGSDSSIQDASQKKASETVSKKISEHRIISQDKITLSSEEDSIVYTEFIAEGTEHLEHIEVKILDLEKFPDDIDMINEIFRPIHSLKGAAGFLGLTTINHLCHELETMLDRARKLTLTIDNVVIDTLLSGIDILKGLLITLQDSLNQILDGNKDYVSPPVDITDIITRIKSILDRKDTLGPQKSDLAPDPEKLGGKLLQEGHITQKDLEAALGQQGKPIGQILIDMGAVSADTINNIARSKAEAGKAAAAAIKVDTTKLDNLMESVGELVIAQSLIEQDRFFKTQADPITSKKMASLAKITRNLQDMVMSIRMVPLKQTFQKMYRLIRDTCQKTGKEAKLIISGEDTEIDKTVIEELADPLVHLLRNAVDHGIDTPEERKSKDKDPQGKVGLHAYHQAGNVVIEVSDDGQGIEKSKVLKKAIEKGMASPDRDYTDSEIFAFLFAAGFSTAEKTTDISGRGVGMDVVKRNIEKLGGRVDIRSEFGSGTTFCIRLPLTMAIVDGMVVLAGKERYVIPTLSIEESIRPTSEMINTVRQKGEMIMVRNQLIPLLRLEKVFSQADNTNNIPLSEKLVIILTSEGKRTGLVVDSLIGQQQVVIKNLGEKLRGISGVSGGCILGDGKVALIMDVSGLVELSEKSSGGSE